MSDPSNALWQRELALSYSKIGDVEVPQGNLPAALASYQAGFAILDHLANSDPGNNNRQRDLKLSYDNIGDVQLAQGSLPAALRSYQAGLAIAFDPGNTKWQRDLSVSYDRVGDAQVQQNTPGRAEFLPSGPCDRPAFGEFRSRQWRLAARSGCCVQQDWRGTGHDGRIVRCIELLSGGLRDL